MRRGAARAGLVIAALALALWGGGAVALGAFAAPAVFGTLPAQVAAAAFSRTILGFDKLTIACATAAVVGLALVPLASRRGRWLSGLRAAVGAVALASALYRTTAVDPRIEALRERGVTLSVVRETGESQDQRDLRALHGRAEGLAKAEALLALALLGWVAAGGRANG